MAAFTVGAATLHQLLVELLQVVGSQFRELDAADTGNCVLLNHQSIAIRRGDANIWLGIDVVPAPQPCSHGVLVGAADVDTLGGLHRGSKFRLALRLRFAEDVFDDALAGRWVVSRGVTPLPPTIAAFADVALTVGAFLGH